MSGLARKRFRAPDRCPVGGSAGQRVGPMTVKHLVKDDHVIDAETAAWFLCKGRDCRVVYFASDGRTICKDAMRVRVGVKEKNPPRLVCYCFGHTVESIQDEIERTGKSTVMDSVSAKVLSGDCSCEIMNPEGSCCLGEMNRAVKEALATRYRQSQARS